MKQNLSFTDRSAIIPPLIPLSFPSFFCGLHSAERPKLPSAIRARVDGILHTIDAKRNQATASPTAHQNQTSTSQPSQRTRGILHRCDYGCTAVRANHGSGRLAEHSTSHNNSLRLCDDRCGSLALRWWRPIPLWRWVALMRWWVALRWRIAWLLWISGLAWWRIACSSWLIRWWFIRHDGSSIDYSSCQVILYNDLIFAFRRLTSSSEFRRSIESSDLPCSQQKKVKNTTNVRINFDEPNETPSSWISSRDLVFQHVPRKRLCFHHNKQTRHKTPAEMLEWKRTPSSEWNGIWNSIESLNLDFSDFFGVFFSVSVP